MHKPLTTHPRSAGVVARPAHMLRAAAVASLSAATVLAAPAPASAATTNVECDSAKLQLAIATANTNPGPDTLELAPECTYTLQAPSTPGTGLPPISSEVTIRGDDTTIQRDPAAVQFRILAVQQDGVLHLDRLTIRGGNTTDFGGGISNDGTLKLTASTISDNTAPDGGGIHNAGGTATTVTGSRISDNTAEAGGGIHNDGGAVTVSASTISDNTAPDGGGISNDGGAVTVTGSTISGNIAGFGFGGGISNFAGGVGVFASTISFNLAGFGGGIESLGGGVGVFASTISGNTADGGFGGIEDYGGGIRTHDATAAVYMSILAGNTPTNCDGSVDDDGYNLEDSVGCGFTAETSLSDTDPQLNFLADNGGPTLTHLPAGGSPAVDAGPDTCEEVDQRGVPRPQGDRCDIGAVERIQADPGVNLSGTPDPAPDRSQVTYTAEVFVTGGDTGGVVKDITLVDQLPGGVRLVQATATQGNCQAVKGARTTITCHLGQVTTGEQATVSIEVAVTGAAASPLTNTVVVDGDPNPNPDNDTDTVTF